MRTSSLLGCCLFFLGCGVTDTPGVDRVLSERSEIVGGVIDNGDPAVVALAVGGGGQFQEYCTGTLIAPKTILTAAHCINVYGSNAPYYALFGTYAAQPTQVVRIIAQYADPQYSSSGSTHDFGVLQLSAAVTNVTPIAMNNVALTSALVGQTIRHVGFGVTNGTSQTGGGTKREVSYTVRKISSALIESGGSGKQTCSGDSGGPAFMILPGNTIETVVGVVSFGDQTCTQFGADGRVDVAFAWVSQTMAPWEGPTCASDGKCKTGCTPVDQDCACVGDGVCNPDCAELLKDPDCPKDCVPNGVCALEACPRPDSDCVGEGGPCASPLQCKGRACVSDEQHPTLRYCTSACTPNSSNCVTGMECAPQLVCLLTQKPVKELGEICTGADFCGHATICTGPGSGLTRCVQGCARQADCADDTTCEGGADGQRFCRAPESVVRFYDVVLERATVEGPAAPSGCASAGFGDLSFFTAMLGALSLIRRRRS